MATSDVLAALDDETQLRIVANTLGGGELTGTQKQHIVDVNKRVLQDFNIQSAVRAYVADHPDFLVNKMFPPVDTKNFADGNISIGTQETYTKNLALVFNAVNGQQSDMCNIDDDQHDDFVKGNWLQDVPTVDNALKKRNSRGTSRRGWIDACRQLCRVFAITDSTNPCDWPSIAKQYDVLIKRIDFGRDEQESEVGTNDCARHSEKYKAMTQEEADGHVQSVRDYSAKLLEFVQPLLESLTGENETRIAKALSKMHVFQHAADDHNKKRLGTWAIDCILMLWQHGQCDDADLRPMRTGDPFKFKFATVNSATGHGSWIICGDNDEVFACMKNSSTKIGASARVPLHDRCPELAKFLKLWYQIMKVYQGTDEPCVACKITSFKAWTDSPTTFQ